MRRPRLGHCRFGIDLHATEGRRAHQHGVGEGTKRHRIVSGALGRDPLAVSGRGTDNIAHLVGAARHRNAGGLLVDQNIEGPALDVPVDVLSGQKCCGHACP